VKKLILVVLFLSTTLLPIHTKAEFRVPASKESEQWKVELLVPEDGKDFAKGEKGKHEVYSLLVTNKGKKVYDVNLGVFRNEEGNNKMYGLAPQMESDIMDKGQTFDFRNFPVKELTEKLEFVIIWEDDPITLTNGQKASGRTFKETFTFFSEK
jgi:hypothetical protein